MLNSPIGSQCNPPALTLGCSGQMSGGVAENASIGWGNFNGAFVSFKTTDWHGLTSQQNFMYSKALGTGAFVQATSEYTPNDPWDIGNMYGVQGFNHKFVYNLYMAYSPSVYKGQQGFAGRILGGWSFAPIFTAGSGGPQYCNTQTDAQAFGSGDGANYFDNEQCIFTGPAPSAGTHYTHNSDGTTSVNLFSNPDAVAAQARPPILGIDHRDNGVGPIAKIPYWNLDFQVRKQIRLTERFGLEAQFMFLNVLNHVQLDNTLGGVVDPLDLSYGSSGWGDISSQENNPRQMEFGIRLNF
jgi:hypothetical protein